MTKPKETRVEQILKILHQNKFTAFVIVIGMIVIAAAAFTNALKDLREFFWNQNQESKLTKGPFPSISTTKLVGRVIDFDTKAPIFDAKVILEAGNIPLEVYTDSKGVFAFALDDSLGEVRIRIQAAEYENFNQYLNLSSKIGIEDIRIQRLEKNISPVMDKEKTSVNKNRDSSQMKINSPKKTYEFEISTTNHEDGVKIYLDNDKTPRAIVKGGLPIFLQLEVGIHILRAVKVLKNGVTKIHEKQISVPEDSPLYLRINNFDSIKEKE